MRALGLDVGDKTVGLAISDDLGLTAQGITTLRRKDVKSDLDFIAALCAERQVEVLVVGLPLNMDGSEGPRAALTRTFARKLTERTGLPVEFQDERLSTSEVTRVLLQGDASRKKRREVVDQLAAQVILQGWMDARSARSPWGEEEP